MPDLRDGESASVQGSVRQPYILKNVGGVYSCTCPAWRNQSLPIERRTCKHLRAYRGEEAERQRLGDPNPSALSSPASRPKPSVPGFLLAQPWENDLDLSGWWMSEQLDGVRAWWDGTRFLSRQGNVYHAPPWFTAGLPGVPLDGELWLGRKAFQRTVSIIRRHDQSELWREIRYRVFDAPCASEVFGERQRALFEIIEQSRPPFAQVLDHACCTGSKCLKAEFARIESLGGEGLMLRQSTSPAQRLRTSTAAARVSIQWLGTRKTLTPDQKAEAAEPFGAEANFLSAGKKLLDTSHPAFKAVTAVRGRVVNYWKGVSMP